MSEPVDLSGLDFAVEMMRRPSPESIAEQLTLVTTDRDIKAANLQLLVEKVLMFETQDSAFQVAPEIRELWDGLFDLARGLKQ